MHTPGRVGLGFVEKIGPVVVPRPRKKFELTKVEDHPEDGVRLDSTLVKVANRCFGKVPLVVRGDNRLDSAHKDTLLMIVFEANKRVFTNNRSGHGHWANKQVVQEQ